MFNTKSLIEQENIFIDGDFFENINIENIKYFKIDYIKEYLTNNNLLDIKFDTLITHNGDKGIDNNLFDLAINKNSKIIKWYGQNIQYIHKDLICIPIGLERKRWYTSLKKQQQLKDIILNNTLQIIPEHLCYANFSIDTNSTQRLECLKSLKNILYTNKISNVVKQQTFLDYTNYLIDILNHKFNVCPVGNGIDTHRMRETLYLGRIPIVIKNEVTESFKDLPILILNKWEDLNNSLLINFINTFDIKKYSLNKLRVSYWENLISGK